MPIGVDKHAHKALEYVVLMVGVLLLSWMWTRVDAAERGDVQQGQRLYRYYCAPCHGLEGTGAGRNAPYLEQMGRAPRDHTDIWYMNRLSDAELYRAISEGKRREGEPPFMPWWGLYALATGYLESRRVHPKPGQRWHRMRPLSVCPPWSPAEARARHGPLPSA